MNTNADAIPSWNALGQIVLPQRSAEQFQRMGTPVTLAKNQTLYKVGDVPDSCYYVCQGRIVAFDCTPAGGEHIFSVNVPGELILVPSMVVTHPLVLNFKASEPTHLIRIHRETLFQEMADDAEFSAQLVYALSVRLIDTIEQSRERGSYSVPWRVCNLFLSMAGRYGVPYDGKVLIQKKMSQQAMGQRTARQPGNGGPRHSGTEGLRPGGVHQRILLRPRHGTAEKAYGLPGSSSRHRIGET
ncbi:MAG: Crp/Fnr family transcriptional regulator [Clostridiales bacterium]|nr:Crp/Fnr family transcriptional regulator [Clostridiales bacterium]